MITKHHMDHLESLARKDGQLILGDDLAEEMIRLARLGRWAEERGIPALREARDQPLMDPSLDGWADLATKRAKIVRDALAQLPKVDSP